MDFFVPVTGLSTCMPTGHFVSHKHTKSVEQQSIFRKLTSTLCCNVVKKLQLLILIYNNDSYNY